MSVGRIGRGLLILLGVGPDDDRTVAEEMAAKVAALRIFPDADGRTNLALPDVDGSALVVSQFTLYADTRRGRRPSFIGAGSPEAAQALYETFCGAMAGAGVPVERGRFGEKMEVELVNDGPFTIWLDSAER